MDPNTGMYLCELSSTKRCNDCLRIFTHNVINVSGVSNKFWNDFGCPFCHDTGFGDGMNERNLNRYLIYKTLSIINYNEYVMSQKMETVEGDEQRLMHKTLNALYINKKID